MPGMSLLHVPTQPLTASIIGAAIEVHRRLGPGLLESAYQRCLARELWLRGLEFREQVALTLDYKGLAVTDAFRIDLVVGRTVLVEIKSVETLLPVHSAQMITYLKLTGVGAGLLINFNVPVLRQGIRRLLNDSVNLRSLRSSV